MKPLERDLQNRLQLDKDMMRDAQRAMERQADRMRTMELALSPQAAPLPPLPPGAPPAHPAPIAAKAFAFQTKNITDEERAYRSAKSQLEDRDYDNAVKLLDRLIEKKGSRADASLYWKAYAQNKLGRRNEASATLAELVRAYPQSRWLDDAKALEVEIKSSSGQAVSPDSEADEDLKVLAVNGMMHTDPDRAVPVLENLMAKSSSPRLKERALFVLAQSKSPRAREVLLKLAKGGANPDIQYKSVEYLGYQNTPETKQVLQEIYSSSSDVSLKRAVLRGFTASRDKERLLTAAKSEQSIELKREAIRGLGATGANAELWQLYQADASAEVKMEILRAIPARKENVDKLTELAAAENDPKVKRELVLQLGYVRTPESTSALVKMYGTSSDATARRAIIDSLRYQNSAKPLVDIARAENDPKLKRVIVESLSHMKSKEASDYLLEVLNK
jgi:HEAT repeat protein